MYRPILNLRFSFVAALILSLSSSVFAANTMNVSEIENGSDHIFTESVKGAYAQQIEDTAARSSCSSYSWRNRGRAPAGYIKGVSLSFARSLCRLKASNTPSVLAKLLSAASTGNSSKDALTYYQSIFSSLQMKTNTAGEDSLRALYTLGFGLGMRESSGAYCVGWDTSAGGNRPSSAGEAGAFQTSYDSIGANPELMKLYREYQASPGRCQLDVFKEGATCRPQRVLGTGAGADFQAFNKACPAFATEYAMTLLRVLRQHFGPINRKEAQVIPACNSLLQKVQQIVEASPQAVCQELL